MSPLQAPPSHRTPRPTNVLPVRGPARRGRLAAPPASTPSVLPAPVPAPPHPADEDVELAELRSDDSGGAIVTTVTHGGKQSTCEVRREARASLLGPWTWEWTGTGTPAGTRARWTQICSETNAEAAYTELELDLGRGLKIERQVFLARRDQFVFLADVVHGLPPGVGGYRMQIPLAPGIHWAGAAETWEGELVAGRRRLARVLPLSLPEWRTEPGGELTATASQLTCTLPVAGRRLQAALWIDLDPKRLSKPVTWRRLTVGQNLEVVPPDVAAGYRVQVGKSQWLIYRSLAPAGNRTVLGQNFSSDFVVARFLPSGITQKLLEIE